MIHMIFSNVEESSYIVMQVSVNVCALVGQDNGPCSFRSFLEPSLKVAKSYHGINSTKKPTINSPIAIARIHPAAKPRKAPSAADD